MEKIKIENLIFKYPQRDVLALNNISLTINKGEFLLICGKSGCGKSTLLRMLKPSLSPHGQISGTISFDGDDIKALSQKEQAEKIGFVMQNPDTQIVCDKVWHELSFGLENLGLSTSEIRARVAETASFFGIQNWFYRNVSELSGGQKQLLNLAAVMVMQPSVLILDEPTSQLDPIAASEFLQSVAKINKELGTTVILTEHRLEEAFPLADKIAVLENGKVLAYGNAAEVGQALKSSESDMFWALPSAMRIFYLTDGDGKCPVTVRDGREWIENKKLDEIPISHYKNNTDIVFELKEIWFRYEKNMPDVLKGLSICLHSGELYAITGGNGSGKTTALSVMAGLKKPYRGKVLSDEEQRIIMLPQNPQSIFSHKTVMLDLEEMLDGSESDYEEKRNRINRIISMCEIENIVYSHPYDLSGGELQRAALAMALLKEPDILLLDEPTKGMDAAFKIRLGKTLKKLCENGMSIIMVSHDIEFCARYADRAGMMFDGQIVSEGGVREFFGGKSFYTTAVNRIVREKQPNVVIDEDFIAALGGSMPKTEEPELYDYKKGGHLRSESKTVKKLTPLNIILGSIFTLLFCISLFYFNKTETAFAAIINILLAGIACFNFIPQKKIAVSAAALKQSHKSVLPSVLIMLILVPVTVLFGIYFLDDRRYYFISLLIIAETLAAFAIVFEGRKPKARELVIISVFCAAAVAGRAAFAPLPQFKPMAAVIIISGICFGGETGFLVGAIAAFASNFIFGQGPWTPWQMLTFGIIGFLAGVMYKCGLTGKTRTGIAVFGFLAVLVVYGGIMNPASVIMMQPKPTWQMICTAYVMGLPFDLVHAAATALFLWFGAEPLCEKTERVKIKYGLI